jgi:hypothetical protein
MCMCNTSGMARATAEYPDSEETRANPEVKKGNDVGPGGTEPEATAGNRLANELM